MSVIAARGVSKSFRRYSERNQSLKQAVLRGRRQRFEEFRALDDVSFEIDEGVSFGIIGSNGAGKSTTLKVLAQIIQPDAGEVELHGRVSALLELGAGFHPELSGRENVFLNGAILGLGRKTLSERLDEIIEFSGLDTFIDNPVKTYSSGMYARLGFAVAVNVEPDILLIDEVLAVGDESFQRRCGEKIADIRADGRTVVVVSHGLGQIQALCDQAMWVDHGKVMAIGPAPDVVNAYLGSISSSLREGGDSAGVDDGHGHRIGSGEILIRDFAFVGKGGTSVARPSCGHELSVRLSLSVQQPIESPVVGFWITRTDGVLVAGTRTQHIFDLPLVDVGTHTFWFDMESFDLLPGSYHLGLAVADATVQHMFDLYERYVTFDVLPGGSRQFQVGVVPLRGQWRKSEAS
jgi:ABC-type polysaccharide/polyol phosphate transport system ATPase subunit